MPRPVRYDRAFKDRKGVRNDARAGNTGIQETGGAWINHFAAERNWRLLFGRKSIHCESDPVGSVRVVWTVVKREFSHRNSRRSFLGSVEIKVVGCGNTGISRGGEAASIDAEILTDIIVDLRTHVADYHENGVVIGSKTLHEKQPRAVREVCHDGSAEVRDGVSAAVHDLAQRKGTPAAQQINDGRRSNFHRAGLRRYNGAVGVRHTIGRRSESDVEVER